MKKIILCVILCFCIFSGCAAVNDVQDCKIRFMDPDEIDCTMVSSLNIPEYDEQREFRPELSYCLLNVTDVSEMEITDTYFDEESGKNCERESYYTILHADIVKIFHKAERDPINVDDEIRIASCYSRTCFGNQILMPKLECGEYYAALAGYVPKEERSDTAIAKALSEVSDYEISMEIYKTMPVTESGVCIAEKMIPGCAVYAKDENGTVVCVCERDQFERKYEELVRIYCGVKEE